MDHYTKKALIDLLELGGDDVKVELIDERIFDNEEMKSLKKLGKIQELSGKYKDDWIYEWNENMPWVHEKPWTDTGVWTEPAPVGCYSKLKVEALRNKAIIEEVTNRMRMYESSICWRRWGSYEIADHDQEEREYENGHEE
ncbi:hypothetical protein Tco_0721311 [Tanacetum coccineum]